MSTALAIEHLSASYNGRRALEDITLEVQVGERVAVVGPNGAGKSTLFRAIAGLIPIESGSIRFGDGRRRDEIGYLTQRSAIDWRFPVTVYDVVMMGRVGKIGWFRWYTSEDRQIVRDCLDRVGMLGHADRQIGQLSGGQQQRVFIARALAQEARILLMDEPFTGVDLPSQEAILSIVEGLREQGITVMVSTHDLNLAVERFDRLALLNRRLIAYGPAREAVNSEILAGVYGGSAVWRGDDYVMVMGDIHCCGGDREHTHGQSD